MREKVEKGLDKIRAMLEADGGGVELVDVDEDAKVAKVRLKGACACCPGAQMTLKMGIEQALREEIPDITVEAVSP